MRRIKVIALIAVLLMTVSAFSQEELGFPKDYSYDSDFGTGEIIPDPTTNTPGGGGAGPGGLPDIDEDTDETLPAPIEDGVWLLVAGAVVYTMVRYRAKYLKVK